jgi:hypothetical protein
MLHRATGGECARDSEENNFLILPFLWGVVVLWDAAGSDTGFLWGVRNVAAAKKRGLVVEDGGDGELGRRGFSGLTRRRRLRGSCRRLWALSFWQSILSRSEEGVQMDFERRKLYQEVADYHYLPL